MSLIDWKTIKGITQDSRKVKEGYLFAALPGTHVDGASYVDAAISAGAVAILGGMDLKERGGVKIIRASNPRLDFAKIAAEYYAPQPGYIAAVTGTNGKTSVVHFAQQFWNALGLKGESLGTLSGAMTTPDPVSLHKNLQEIAQGGVTYLALEASSHGLDQYRLDGVRVKVAGFTNLSRDHLDYHKTMAAYLTAKARLFSEVLEDGGVAVLNADIEEFALLQEVLKNRDIRVISYGHNGRDLRIGAVNPTPHGLEVSLNILGRHYDLTIPLVGAFQLMNLLCALGMAMAEGLEDGARREKLVTALETMRGVPGRVQSVTGHPQNASIYVDYAHTPDALETVLRALRPHTKGRLVCLFGCGGDRDPGKRPLMAKTVADYADHGILTDDNPRSEDPDDIRKQALEGAPDMDNIAGRRKAIQHGVDMLSSGDIFVITGKGHEQGQQFKDHTDPFDDVEEAEKAIQNYTKNNTIEE